MFAIFFSVPRSYFGVNPDRVVDDVNKRYSEAGRNKSSVRAIPERKVKDPRLNAIYRSDPLKISLSQLKGYLDERGRNVPSLMSSYFATKDPSLLSELLLNHADDQNALNAVLLWSSNAAEIEMAASHLREKFPNSALPDLMAFSNLESVDENNLGASIELLKNKSEINLYPSKNQEEMHDMLMSIVSDPVKAWAYSRYLTEELDNSRARLMRAIKEIANQSKNSSSPEVSEDGTILAANLMYMLFVNAGEQAGPANNLIMASQEREILKTLDPTIEFGYDGMLVSDRIKEIDENNGRLNRELHMYANFFPSATALQMDNYVEIWRSQGKEAALSYISNVAN